MKKVILISLLYILVSGCSIFKKSATLTDPVRVNVYAITSPVSEQIPGTKRYFKGSDGKKRAFILTDLSVEGGEIVSVYLIDEVYQKLKEKIDLTERQLKLKKAGDKVVGYVLSAQPLEDASIIPNKELKKLSKSDKSVVKTFQNTRKYIVWTWITTEVSFLVGNNGSIDFSSIGKTETVTIDKRNESVPGLNNKPAVDTVAAKKAGRKWD